MNQKCCVLKNKNFLIQPLKNIKFFNEGDVIVINNTKVIKANLEGLNGSKKINFTLHMKKNSKNWFAFAKPAKKCNENDLIIFNNNLTAKIIRKGLNGEVLLEFNISGKKLMDTISKLVLYLCHLISKTKLQMMIVIIKLILLKKRVQWLHRQHLYILQRMY